jgi:hypothetical protein
MLLYHFQSYILLEFPLFVIENLLHIFLIEDE